MCEKAKQDLLDLLERDYEKLTLELTNYALKLIRRHTWRKDSWASNVDGSFVLPGGKSASDIVFGLFVKLLEGDRNWDQQKHPNLLVVLKGMVRSEVSNAYTRKENKTGFVPAEKDGQVGVSFEKSVEPFENKIDYSSGLLQPVAVAVDSSGPVTISSEIVDEIQREATRNQDLVKVIEAIKAGGEKSSEIAEYCELPVAKVYELRRNLNILSEKATKRVLGKYSQSSTARGGAI